MHLRRLRTAIGWLLAFAVLAVLVLPMLRNLDAVRSTLHRPDLRWLALGVALLAAYYGLRATLWHTLTRALSVRVGWRIGTRIWFLTEFVRYLPGNVWSFLGRAGAYRVEGVPVGETTVALIREGLTIVATAGLSLLLLGHRDSLVASMGNLVGILAGALTVALLLPIRFRSVQPPTLGYRLLSVAVALGAWSAFGVGSAAVLRAFHASLPLGELVYVSIGAWLLGYASLITPSGIGVREAAVQGYLVRVPAVLPATASALTLSSRVVLTLVEVALVGAVLLALPRSRAELGSAVAGRPPAV